MNNVDAKYFPLKKSFPFVPPATPERKSARPFFIFFFQESKKEYRNKCLG